MTHYLVNSVVLRIKSVVARSRLAALAGTLGVATLAMSGCEPCSGVARCSSGGGNPYLAVDGQIVEPTTGQGVDGVRVQVIRRGGVVVARDSIATVTANGGHWRVEFSAASAGSIDAEAKISTPGGVSYTVPALHLISSPRVGDANFVDRWVTMPYFPNAGEIYLRGTVDQRIAGATVEFRRTGGVGLVGPGVADGVFRSVTDFGGRVPLFNLDYAGVFSDAVGDVVGDLVIRRSSTDSSVVRGLHLASSYVYRADNRILRFGVGPSVSYQAELHSRATGARVPGVMVDFQRMGGVELTVPAFSTTTDGNGRFAFPTWPLSSGTVQGRLIFRAPIPSTPETLFVALPTFDDDASRFYGVFGVGAYLPYYGIVVLGGTGVDGVKVDVARVSGIDITPSTFTTVTSNGGIFAVHPVPGSLGDVVVDLTFRPPGFSAYTVRGVKLSTADRQVSDRAIGVFRVDAPP